MGVWKKFGVKNNFSSTPPSNLNYDWSLVLNFTGDEKTQEEDVPQNGFEKDAATGPMAGDVIVCFAN